MLETRYSCYFPFLGQRRRLLLFPWFPSFLFFCSSLSTTAKNKNLIALCPLRNYSILGVIWVCMRSALERRDGAFALSYLRCGSLFVQMV
ncbi:hypothetical protein C8R44DRAFT_139631 [Mycena epipterygia]|nr:hypothetical protein C8R44DRAFT_139631 [Mycena epipterygia]